MTKVTGSNNLAGLLGGLVETIETMVGFAEDKLSEFVDGDDSEDDGSANFKAVFNLGLSDSLVLEDGAWQVVAIEEDGFDASLVSVALANGETYNLLRTSLVWVV